ncbi:GNAT family N-acetyltransferase [Aestuariivirga sp.]|uniref:GNAT family N-acetyltransferase n=1 Tax=Aestuariivirga sp. TaxID=2650926 RepID=UPI0039E492A3
MTSAGLDISPVTLTRRTAAARLNTGAYVPPRDAHFGLASTVHGLELLKADWRMLECTGIKSHGVFQTYDWVASWAKTFCGGKSGDEPFIISGYQGDELKFLWPLMKTRVGPVTVLRWAAEPLSQYGDILLARGECAKSWMAAATDFIRHTAGLHSIRLRHVRQDANCQPFLQEAFRDARLVEQAPWLDLSAYADDAAYDARYNSNQRRRRKKIRKALEDEFGPVVFEVLENSPANDAAMAQAVAEKCRWIDERGRQNQILNDAALLEFLKDFSRNNSGNVRLITSQMKAGSKTLSWEIGLRFGASHFGFITSHINELTDYSPARLHMDFSQRRALADGMTVFDLMVPHDPHKESWSSAATETRDYHLPLSARGWLYGTVYLETLRPLLRDTYYRLPAEWLRRLKPFTGH